MSHSFKMSIFDLEGDECCTELNFSNLILQGAVSGKSEEGWEIYGTVNKGDCHFELKDTDFNVLCCYGQISPDKKTFEGGWGWTDDEVYGRVTATKEEQNEYGDESNVLDDAHPDDVIEDDPVDQEDYGLKRKPTGEKINRL